MAERRTGTVTEWNRLSPVLAVFRLMPEAGSAFPDYRAGQYIALRREDCRLTKRVVGEDGKPQYVPDLDESGQHRRGPVTHSYSISSAPFETREQGFLEFYVVLEQGENEYPGRLTESLFRVEPSGDNQVGYVSHIAGDFTLDKRAAGFRNVVFVGTGTGLAPFAAMVKELDQAARSDDKTRYTLLHTNRTFDELAYHETILAIEMRQRFDFRYVPSVSRPAPDDMETRGVGTGRANNLLRLLFGMPIKEQEALEAASGTSEEPRARTALASAVKPALPRHVSLDDLAPRLVPAETVILTCGNPSSMADIRHVADTNSVRYEKEDWKLVLPARA